MIKLSIIDNYNINDSKSNQKGSIQNENIKI